jgi:Na+/melibiose symporter-like transporter
VASGRQRTGLFFGIFGMVTKAAIALGVLLATVLPAALGFDPGVESPSDAAVLGMLGIYGFLPGALMAAGAHFLWRFPLTREVQAELRAKLEARSEG